MMTDPASKKKFIHIGEVLRETLLTIRREKGGRLDRIGACWPAVVGDLVGAHTVPEALKGSLLLVRVDAAPWAQEMRFMKADIIDRLNAALGEAWILDIKFKVG